MRALGCCCRYDAATWLVISPSTERRMTLALPSPQASRTTLRAERIVSTPMVMALRGTFHSPKKSEAASRRVTRSSVIRRVRRAGRGAGAVEAAGAGGAAPRDREAGPPPFLVAPAA